jgi:serine protease Do
MTFSLGVLALALLGSPGAGGEEKQFSFHLSAQPYLGVTLGDVGSEEVSRLKLGEERGALIKRVEGDSPAEKAGLKEGDVILRYQGELVQSAAQLARLVRETPSGRTVSLEVNRTGQLQKVSARLDERRGGPGWDLGNLDFPPMPLLQEGFGKEISRHVGEALGKGHRGRKLGIHYQEISGQLAQYFHLKGDEGVLIVSVDEDGPAAKGGLRAGDVILKIAGAETRGAEQLQEQLEKAESGREVVISVQRDGKPLDLTVKLGGGEAGKPAI